MYKMLKLPMLFVFIFQCTSLSFASEAEYGPRSFSETEKWTAVVAAYEPEIQAIDRAFAQMGLDKILKKLSILHLQVIAFQHLFLIAFFR